MPNNDFSINISFDTSSFARDFSAEMREHYILGDIIPWQRRFLDDNNLEKYVKYEKPKRNYTYRELLDKMEIK